MPKTKTKTEKAIEQASREAYADAALIARTAVGDGATESEVAVTLAISQAIDERANIVWGV